MKNKMPPVTSVYFISLLKAYLRGTKTKQEVIQDLSGDINLQPGDLEDTGEDVTRLLLRTATAMHEDYYQEIVGALSQATDSTPTREGVIHQLEALLAGRSSQKDLLQWATWHNDPGEDNGVSYFEDLAVDYFCTQLLPNPAEPLTTDHYQQALKIFKNPLRNQLKDKVALVLLFEKEKQRFLFYVGDYIQGHTAPEQLDVYLLNKFGMDHYSFPYMTALSNIMYDPAKLPALLKVAAGGHE
ncbi:hypothetical protein [Chitinophaga qingshengii]|uniref:Uncharacterized protein n=1 Tax=Chitinophaga qingshengii TaxID=1569794 RepID=A0ABR7THU3_9BACT|nr:hypothetical protein [Chitinophaga qingshengii]MBC9930077.1 hypothetical protein [Chitinophaga qingshengii]